MLDIKGKKGPKSGKGLNPAQTGKGKQQQHGLVEQGCVSASAIVSRESTASSDNQGGREGANPAFRFNQAEFEAEAAARYLREKEMFHTDLLKDP